MKCIHIDLGKIHLLSIEIGCFKRAPFQIDTVSNFSLFCLASAHFFFSPSLNLFVFAALFYPIENNRFHTSQQHFTLLTSFIYYPVCKWEHTKWFIFFSCIYHWICGSHDRSAKKNIHFWLPKKSFFFIFFVQIKGEWTKRKTNRNQQFWLSAVCMWIFVAF